MMPLTATRLRSIFVPTRWHAAAWGVFLGGDVIDKVGTYFAIGTGREVEVGGAITGPLAPIGFSGALVVSGLFVVGVAVVALLVLTAPFITERVSPKTVHAVQLFALLSMCGMFVLVNASNLFQAMQAGLL